MSPARLILTGSLCLFATIGVVAFVKKGAKSSVETSKINTAQALPKTESASPVTTTAAKIATSASREEKQENYLNTPSTPQPTQKVFESTSPPATQNSKDDFPQVDRIHQLFNTKGVKLPIVDTIVYNSRVEWLKGRPAWISDYAAHYATSRHFIARSLNGKPDYFSQKVSTGGKFNVFRTDKDIQFYILVDVSRFKAGLYYFDKGTNDRVLLKTYNVSLGRSDSHSPSGCITPLGLYSLGNKIAVFQPGATAPFSGKKSVEMVKVFGTRWIPFDQEIEGCTSPAKGFGMHGLPLESQAQADGNVLVEDRGLLGTNTSDGGVRFAAEDIEEIFSIVITKPAFVLIVKDFHDARLPGIEVDLPSSNPKDI